MTRKQNKLDKRRRQTQTHKSIQKLLCCRLCKRLGRTSTWPGRLIRRQDKKISFGNAYPMARHANGFAVHGKKLQRRLSVSENGSGASQTNKALLVPNPSQSLDGLFFNAKAASKTRRTGNFTIMLFAQWLSAVQVVRLSEFAQTTILGTDKTARMKLATIHNNRILQNRLLTCHANHSGRRNKMRQTIRYQLIRPIIFLELLKKRCVKD
jgi:hypothetical protein